MMTLFLLAAAALGTDGPCRVLTVAKQAGQVVEVADTSPGLCATEVKAKAAEAKLVFDRRTSTVKARTALPVGEDLGRAYFPAAPRVRPGDHLTLAAHIGRVTIARDVVAMQPAKRGERFFARAEDGGIFVVPAMPTEANQ
jgi:hypothetical protein